MFAQTTTHASLLQRVAGGGDAGAWREFCQRYESLIRGFAVRRGLPASDCDDILQDVLVSLTQALPGFTYDPAKGKFRSYLKTVVLRAIFKQSRQKRAASPLEDIEELTRAADVDSDVERVWDEEWRQHHLQQAMRVIEAEFNAADRTAFQAYAVEGREVRSVAEELSLSPEQVYQAKSRILRRLGQLIEQQVADEG